MEAVASDQDLYNAFAEETLLAEMLRDPEFRAKVGGAVEGRPKHLGHLWAFMRGLSAGWRLAAAAAVAALLLITVTAVYRAKRPTEGGVAKRTAPQRARKRNAAEYDRVQAQIAEYGLC